MYAQERINPYNKKGEKKNLVEAMFDNIAPTYDTLNHRLSLHIDKLWRKKSIGIIEPYKPETILDVASGTGDMAILAAEKTSAKKIIGADISDGMLEIGRKKVEQKNLSNTIEFRQEDCLSLSFQDNTFDAVIAAFGIRNFANLEKGLSEMYRVMKKGGHLSIVELTRPVTFPMRQLFSIYSHTILPFYGRLLSKDKGAYSYLTSTIEAFPQGETMVEVLRKTGFSEACFKRMTFGICTLYFAEK